MRSSYGKDRLLQILKIHLLIFRPWIIKFLHYVASLRMSKPMDSLSSDHHSNTYTCPYSYVCEWVSNSMLSKFELSKSSSIDIGLDANGGPMKLIAKNIIDWLVSPYLFWSGSDWSIINTFSIEANGPERSNANESIGISSLWIFTFCNSVFDDESVNLLDGDLRIFKGSAISALDYVEIDDFSMLIEEGLTDGYFVIRASKLNANELRSFQKFHGLMLF